MEELRNLGLSKYETAIYTALLQNGKSDAKTIAAISKVPPTSVYPNLKRLEERQLIKQIKGDISLFAPINPSLALKNFIETRKKELEQRYTQTIKKIEKFQKIENKKEVLEITYGKDISSRIHREAIKNSVKSYYILGWRFEKIGDMYDLLKIFKKAIKRKVDVRIILTGNKNKQQQLIKDYVEEGIKIRYFPLDNFSLTISDSKDCKITTKNRENHERNNILIHDNDLARSMNDYFLSLWKKSQPVQTTFAQ